MGTLLNPDSVNAEKALFWADVGRNLAGRRRATNVALLLVALLLVACGRSEIVEAPPEADAETVTPTPEADEADAEQSPEDEATEVVAADPAGEPARVIIEAIDVDAELVRLGLDEDNHMEVPDFGLAGWYVEGPKPGHPGPSVIAAHVDSRSGPDVFYRLKELGPGDEVRVVFDSGEEVLFEVDADPVQTPKDELPGDDIWPVTNERQLTLITCGGIFDRSIGHYEDNIIVFTMPMGADA
jgi:sortase (surface protein transpeptidase)